MSARLHQPAFCVLRCSSSSVGEELVVAVRGLDDVTDVLTASEAEAAPLLDGAPGPPCLVPCNRVCMGMASGGGDACVGL